MKTEMTQKTAIQVASQYFDAFGKGDLQDILALFAPDATVKSSSAGYKELEPKTFYEKVLAMTHDKSISIHSVAVDQHNCNIVIVHFSYDWTLSDKTQKSFPNAFDLFKIDPVNEKITSLTINLGADVLGN